MEELKYPNGKYHSPKPITEPHIRDWIKEIATLPDLLKSAVASISDGELSRTYRPGSWNVRQLVHHLADSHLNSYIRFKWALTENTPHIKVYDEKIWAELPDATTAPIEVSLNLITGLHERWVFMLNKLTPGDFEKTFYHPEMDRELRLDWTLGLYAWHGKHHVAHIKIARTGSPG